MEVRLKIKRDGLKLEPCGTPKGSIYFTNLQFSLQFSRRKWQFCSVFSAPEALNHHYLDKSLDGSVTVNSQFSN